MKLIESFNFSCKKVFVRVDFNVPILEGVVADYSRIDAALATINYLLKQNAKIIISSHFARPNHDIIDNQEFSLVFLQKILETKLQQKIHFSKDFKLNKNDFWQKYNIILLENLRFNPGEEANDDEFARALAKDCDFYVNEAFSCSHRNHASIVAITKFLQSFAGLQLSKEVSNLKKLFDQHQAPFAAIIGGSKISSKIELIENLLGKVSWLFIGGAMANNFLKAQGYNIGISKHEENLVNYAKNLLDAHHNIYFPEDLVVSTSVTDKKNIRVSNIADVGALEMILDIGPKTIEKISQLLIQTKILVFNGPLGVFEIADFSSGTFSVIEKIAQLTEQSKLISIAGGGDSLNAINQAKYADKISYLSTAGGAFLEWLEGKKLPGIVALENNNL